MRWDNYTFFRMQMNSLHEFVRLKCCFLSAAALIGLFTINLTLICKEFLRQGKQSRAQVELSHPSGFFRILFEYLKGWKWDNDDSSKGKLLYLQVSFTVCNVNIYTSISILNVLLILTLFLKKNSISIASMRSPFKWMVVFQVYFSVLRSVPEGLCMRDWLGQESWCLTRVFPISSPSWLTHPLWLRQWKPHTVTPDSSVLKYKALLGLLKARVWKI